MLKFLSALRSNRKVCVSLAWALFSEKCLPCYSVLKERIGGVNKVF